MGIPVVGCPCAVCQSSDARNKRLRPSALITVGGKTILIDAGPDFRTQALTHSINRLDGVIFTHAHHDHTAGIDELRVYNMWTGESLPCLVSQETAVEIQDRFKYIFTKDAYPKKLVSKLKLIVLEKDRGEIDFLGLKIKYFSYEQAGMHVNGYQIGNLGFVTDIKKFPDTVFEDLRGVQKLVLSALRMEFSTIHFNFDEAIQFSSKIKASETWLTHIAHETDYETGSRDLPSKVNLAYDGLSLDFQL